MIYRPIGNTGMNASIIGLGCEHLDNKPYEVAEEVIHAALENGINILDVFMPGTPVRENISKALGNRRKDVIIQGHIGSVDINEQYDRTRDVDACKKYFENLLTTFKTDYIDLGMMFFIDSEKDFKEVFETGHIDYVQQLKKEGKIRAIGASSHNPVIARKVVEMGVIDLMMFSINLAFDMTPADIYVLDTLGGNFGKDKYNGLDSVRSELYEYCESKNVALTVMKTLGAGKLLSKEHTPFEEPMTTGQCIHYALTRPAVVSTLIGCKSRKEVIDAVNYLNLTEEEKDYSKVIGSVKSSFAGKCVYCNHCLPCPSEIDIATLNKYTDIARLNPKEIPPSIIQHYNSLDHKAGDCIECGSCESKCPFSVPVIKNMNEAKTLFGC